MIRNGAIPNIDENAEVAFSLSQISAVGGSHTILFRHPSNKFMYMLSDNFGAVFRADYDPVAKTFGNPSIIAGNMNDKSFKEGTGGSARFNKPQFGVFVKTRNTAKELVLTTTNMTSIFVTEKITASGNWILMG